MTGKMRSLADSPGASLALMMGAPMAAGVVESMITGGASRIDQTEGQGLGDQLSLMLLALQFQEEWWEVYPELLLEDC